MSKINFSFNGAEYSVPKIVLDSLFEKMDKAFKALNYSIGLEYTSNGDGTCAVTGIGECTDTDVIVPAVSPNGDRVTEIGEDAFYQGNFTSFTIPDSVTKLSSLAFDECTAVKSITLGNSITIISSSALFYCNGLTEIIIPVSVTTIESSAFEQCMALSNLTFAGTVAQWNAIEKGNTIAPLCPVTYVQCLDGTVEL